MDITPEMLAVAKLAPKEKHKDDGEHQKPDELKLTRVQLSQDHTMVASDGTMIAVVRRVVLEDEGDKKGSRSFGGVIPGEQIRRLAGAVDKLKAEEISMRLSGAKIIAETKTDQGEASIQLDILPADEYPNVERFFEKQGQNKTMVAIDSRYLAAIADLRGKVGGHGPVLLFIGRELDNVVGAWRDGVHEARVIVGPSKVDEGEWQALAPRGK